MNCGSVPEIIVDGESGFVCSTINEFVHKVPAVFQLDRHQCRRWVEQFFHPVRMVSQYERAYFRVIANRFSDGHHNNLQAFQRR